MLYALFCSNWGNVMMAQADIKMRLAQALASVIGTLKTSKLGDPRVDRAGRSAKEKLEEEARNLLTRAGRCNQIPSSGIISGRKFFKSRAPGSSPARTLPDSRPSRSSTSCL